MPNERLFDLTIRAAEVNDASALAQLMCELGYETTKSEMQIRMERITTDERFRTAKVRKTNEDELERIVTAWTSTQKKWEVTHRLQAVRVAAYPTMSSKDLLEDPQLNERGFFVRLPHPEVGVRTHAGMPWLLAHAPNGVRAPAPLLGQDTESILHDLLDYSAAEIAHLQSTRVLY